ncbi:MAG: peptidoglycan DD-metalloendopeptidase family protein [Anaerolineales bacterium]
MVTLTNHSDASSHSNIIIFPIFVLVFFLLFPISSVKAQSDLPDGPSYLVQEGDSLWDIAVHFGVAIEDLQEVNGITDATQLAVGSHLVIPGLNGDQGILETQTISYGESLRSLSRRYRVPVDTLVRLNHLTSPNNIYPGAALVIPSQGNNVSSGMRVGLTSGQSLLELAVLNNTNPWDYVLANDLPGTWGALAGDVLFSQEQEMDGPGALLEAIRGVSLEVLPFTQGKTVGIRISGEPGIKLSGSLDGREVNFFSSGEEYVALFGIHAMTEPGLYPLKINGKLPPGPPYYGETFTFSQSVLIRGGDYPFDPVLNVSPETIDPLVTVPEDELWDALGIAVSPEKLWDGIFQSPVPNIYNDCWTSLFGSRRSYNGSPYDYFHSGLDLCGGIGTEIFAPAPGIVVFAEPLVVRGKATVIDHGWGVYTAYDHQSDIFVKAGDYVEPGQLIGLGGATGRVTGPHLHWEVWVGGIQVDPLDWLEKSFP